MAAKQTTPLEAARALLRELHAKADGIRRNIAAVEQEAAAVRQQLDALAGLETLRPADLLDERNLKGRLTRLEAEAEQHRGELASMAPALQDAEKAVDSARCDELEIRVRDDAHDIYRECREFGERLCKRVREHHALFNDLRGAFYGAGRSGEPASAVMSSQLFPAVNASGCPWRGLENFMAIGRELAVRRGLEER